ncbi:MAG TPA: urease accessory protein UreD [Janthinobacterium sp.]|jgi:urease accessory protein|nr:urease accessory protein UreD [Janthinobacterium sp.]
MPDCRTTDQHAAPEQDTQARLTLGFADDAGTTRLVERCHFGPLRVQKPLYPEGGAVCHAIVVHPPGGVVGGDRLAISAHAGPSAHAFLATPGAAKWYRANGKISRQQVSLQAGPGAAIEWMPQESIFFDQADVVLEHSVCLAADARYIGCEILCLGRRASGESFSAGKITQRTQIRRDGKIIWWEQGALAGGGAMLASPLGMHGQSVCATLVAAGQAVPAALMDAMRAALADFGAGAACGATQLKGVLVARYLGHDSEAARRAMLAVWMLLRPHLLGREARIPRIWNT